MAELRIKSVKTFFKTVMCESGILLVKDLSFATAAVDCKVG